MAVILGDVGGRLFGLILVAAIIGIPISIALVRNHRYAEATRYSHMWGWVPGNPEIGRDHGFIEAPPSPYGTEGPRIIREEQGPVGKRAWIVAGPPPSPPVPAPDTDQIAESDEKLLHESAVAVLHESPVAIDSSSDHIPSVEVPPVAPMVPEVRVLGRVEIVGWRTEPDRKIIPELACFLALHADRSVPGEEIRAALWPGDLETTEASMKSLHNMISVLRTNLGKEYVPPASKGSGYQLAPTVRSDWSRFCELVEEANNDIVAEVDFLTEALTLVRGAPFESVAPGSYTWAWTELFVNRMEVAIAKAAVRLAELHSARGDAENARWAVLKGLSASPYDRALWRTFLTVSAADGPGELTSALRHASSVLGDDVREFDGLIHELRSPRSDVH